MSKKKPRPPSQPHRQRLKRPQRLEAAKQWLPTYTGTHLCRAYRKRYGVSWITAFTELEMLDVEIDAAYKEQVLRTLAQQAEQKQQERQAANDEIAWLEHLANDPDLYYWTVLRPDEEETAARRERRKQRKAKQRDRQLLNHTSEPKQTVPVPDEAALVQVIDTMIRSTHHAYGYRHLGELGQLLRDTYGAVDWSAFGCKTLIQFLQKHPTVFRIKWSAPARKGASAVWVRLAYEPKRKEGY